jgi:hypothetical protein
MINLISVSRTIDKPHKDLAFEKRCGIDFRLGSSYTRKLMWGMGTPPEFTGKNMVRVCSQCKHIEFCVPNPCRAFYPRRHPWDAWLVKTDANGNMQWNKTYGGTNDDYAFSVVQTGDGGYVLAGCTDSFGSGGWVCSMRVRIYRACPIVQSALLQCSPTLDYNLYIYMPQ